MNQHQKESQDAIRSTPNSDLHGYTIELCKIYLQKYPEDGLIWLYYGRALTLFSRFDDAENAFDKASIYCEPVLHSIIFSSRGELNSSRGASVSGNLG